MTRNEERMLWAVALAAFGAQAMEQKVLAFLVTPLGAALAEDFPRHVSGEGLAQLVGLLLTNIEVGERPLLGALRTMNREHFQVLRRLQGRLTLSLLADLPPYLVPTVLLRLKAQLDFGV